MIMLTARFPVQALSNLGPFLESSSGKLRFAAVYVLSGVASTFSSYRFFAARSLGASGDSCPHVHSHIPSFL